MRQQSAPLSQRDKRALAKAFHGSEDDIHEAIVKYLAAVVRPEDGFDFHPANEGLRTGWEQGRFKARGGKAGVFDICLLLPCGRVVFVEVKRPGETLNDAQKAFRDTLERFGTPHCIATSVDDVRRFLAVLGVPTREATP